MNKLFTIGHSTHTWGDFLKLLVAHRIEAIGDVRSSPYSGRLPQYNREILERALRAENIRYAFLGGELGARRTEPDCYVDGVARYDLIARTATFQTGMDRVVSGAARFRLALMCAEKDPLECHRTILVCRHLATRCEIHHLLSDGSLESHADAESRLLAEERVPEDDLFMARADLIAQAYDRRGNKIAYHECGEPATHAE